MNEKKRLLKNTGLIAIGNMGAKVIAFILLPMYTSILSTEEYGTYDYIVAVCAFLLPVVTLCMHEAMFRFIIEKGDDESGFTSIISHAFLVVLSGVILLCGIVALVNIWHPISYGNYLLLYLIARILYTFSVNLLRGKGEMQAYAIISSCKNILQIILNIVAVAILRLGFVGLIASMCVSEMLAFLVTALKSKLWKYIKLKTFSVETFRSMITYSLPLVPDAVCAQIINISDRLIISGFLGAGPNGVYSISYKFPNIIETVFHFFYTAWSESASRVIGYGQEKAHNYYQSLYQLIDDVMFSVILVLTASMPILFRIFIRGDYTSGFAYVPILMLAMYFDCLGKFYSGVFTAVKQTGIMATTTVVAAVVNAGINLFLISRCGLYAAALSTLIADFIMVELRRRYIQKFVKIKLNFKKIVLECVFGGVIWILNDYDNWLMITAGVMIAVLYAVVINRKLVQKTWNAVIRKVAN